MFQLQVDRELDGLSTLGLVRDAQPEILHSPQGFGVEEAAQLADEAATVDQAVGDVYRIGQIAVVGDLGGDKEAPSTEEGLLK